MLAYKGTFNLKCKNIKFDLGEVYQINQPLELGNSGFHFCENAENVLDYYEWTPDFKLIEIEVLGDVISDGHKSCTNKFKFVRIIDDENELLELTKSLFLYKDKKLIYKNVNGKSIKFEYDYNGNKSKEIYDDKYIIFLYDSKNKLKYVEHDSGYWEYFERDPNGNVDYYEDSNGYFICKKYYNKHNVTIISKNCHEIDIKNI